jgi:dihydroorotate dehydrogenase (fumarate)
MDLSTTYLGLSLRTPLVPSASPLSEEIDTIKRMEDAGAAAVVLYSLFEEQLTREREGLHHHLTHGTESYAEALSYFPEPVTFHLGPEGYLDHIRKAKDAVDIPIIASLNGASVGGWTDYAQQMQQAGADALELNLYAIPADVHVTGEQIETTYIEILTAIKSVVSIPVALKLSPFFSAMAHMAHCFDAAGADALVLFNRFYQPDIDLEMLEVGPHILFSTPQELRLPLRWIAILYDHLQANLAATSGIHTAEDVLKVLMAGASVTMMCSALLQHGVDHIRTVEQGMRDWMEAHEYVSVRQLQGSMSQRQCPDPEAFERSQYMRTLQSYKLM